MRKRLIFFLIIVLAACELPKDKKTGNEKTKDGVVRGYTESGKLRVEVAYKGGKRNGLARNYYENGKVSLEINYVNDKREGLASWFYKSGKLYQTTEYKNNQKHGLQKKHEENGDRISEARFEQDKPCTGLKEFLSDGKIKKKYPRIRITPIDRLKEQGLYVLAITLTDRNNSVKYFRGKLTPTGCLSNRIVPIEFNRVLRRGEIKYFLPPGGFIMEEVNIIAVVKTALRNTYVLQRSYNIAIDN